MFTKPLLAAAAAALIAAGSLSLSTTSASATYYGGAYFGGGNGWYLGWGHPFAYKPYKPPVRQVCEPIYKTINVWDPYYGWVWKTVYAGKSCSWQPISRLY